MEQSQNKYQEATDIKLTNDRRQKYILKFLKNTKKPWPDEITNEMVKYEEKNSYE